MLKFLSIIGKTSDDIIHVYMFLLVKKIILEMWYSFRFFSQFLDTNQILGFLKNSSLPLNIHSPLQYKRNGTHRVLKNGLYLLYMNVNMHFCFLHVNVQNHSIDDNIISIISVQHFCDFTRISITNNDIVFFTLERAIPKSFNCVLTDNGSGNNS